MGPYDPPQVIKTEVFATLPEKYSKTGSHPGKMTQYYARVAVGVDCYLEGADFRYRGKFVLCGCSFWKNFSYDPNGRN